MFKAALESLTVAEGDNAEYLAKVRAITVGIARDYTPERIYLVRIDNWFGPKWMHFAGKFTAGKHAAIGVHKTRLRVPPFIPSRVITEHVFAGPDFDKTITAAPLHIDCTSKTALTRLIEDIDKHAVFVWFSGDSQAQKRGAVMVYSPASIDATARGEHRLSGSGAFYSGFSQKESNWEPAMLRGVSRNELAHLEESGRVAIQ